MTAKTTTNDPTSEQEPLDEDEDDEPTYRLELRTDLWLPVPAGDDVEVSEDHVLWEIKRTIRQQDQDEAVGRVQAYLINVHRSGNDLFACMDEESDDLADLYGQIFTKYAGVMKKSIARIYEPDPTRFRDLNPMFHDAILYVDKIDVVVAHRGRGVGLLAMEALLTFFRPHITLAFCKPHPFHRELNKRDSKGGEYFDATLAAVPLPKAIKALQRYWARAGFHPLGRSGYFVTNVYHRHIDEKLTRTRR